MNQTNAQHFLGCKADDYTGATDLSSILLANHGPVIGGKDFDSAVYAAEKLEETAKLFLLLRTQATQFLNEQQVRQLQQTVY